VAGSEQMIVFLHQPLLNSLLKYQTYPYTSLTATVDSLVSTFRCKFREEQEAWQLAILIENMKIIFGNVLGDFLPRFQYKRYFTHELNSLFPNR